MSTTNSTAAPTQHAAPVPNTTIDEAYSDALGGMADRENWQYGDVDDEKFVDQRAREEREVKIDKRLKVLSGPHAVAMYREVARQSKDVTDSEYRVLDTLLSFSTKLKNCFPSRKTVLAKLGGKGRKAWVLDRHRRSLERKGWLKRIQFWEGDRVAPASRARETGLLESGNETGRFISATGYVFCIPPNEIGPGERGWEGPRVFDRRLFGKRKRTRE